MNIVENQRRSYAAQASDAARRLADTLRNLSPAERAAMIAYAAQQAGVLVDIAMIGEPGDWREARDMLADKLRLTHDHRWELGSGCHLQIIELPR